MVSWVDVRWYYDGMQNKISWPTKFSWWNDANFTTCREQKSNDSCIESIWMISSAKKSRIEVPTKRQTRGGNGGGFRQIEKRPLKLFTSTNIYNNENCKLRFLDVVGLDFQRFTNLQGYTANEDRWENSDVLGRKLRSWGHLKIPRFHKNRERCGSTPRFLSTSLKKLLWWDRPPWNCNPSGQFRSTSDLSALNKKQTLGNLWVSGVSFQRNI